MDDVLICPDCGGVIGATEVTEAGKPCTCFDYGKKLADDSGTGMEMPSGESGTEMTSPTETVKICIKCGMDVSGHRRLKDTRGYICYDCAKEERRVERAGRIRCASCSRWALPEAIVEYEGLQICDRCLRERQEAAKKSFKRFGLLQHHTQHEKKELYILLGIAGLLILIILLSKIGVLPAF